MIGFKIVYKVLKDKIRTKFPKVFSVISDTIFLLRRKLNLSLIWTRRVNLKRLIVCFLVLIIIPIYFAKELFWFNVEIPVRVEKVSDGTILIIDKNKYIEEISKPKLKNSIRKAIQSPLDLSNFKLCFENVSNIEIVGRNSSAVPMDVIFYTASQEIYTKVHFSPKERKCLNFNANKELTFKLSRQVISVRAQIPFSVATTMEVKPDEDASIFLWDKVVSSLIFIFGFWSFTLVFREILKLFLDKNRWIDSGSN